MYTPQLDPPNGRHIFHNVIIHCVAHPGTGQVKVFGLEDEPYLGYAIMAISWLSMERDNFLRSGFKFDMGGGGRDNYDFSFYMDPPGLKVFPYALERIFFIAVASMVTGWEVHSSVRKEWGVGV